MLIRYHLKYYSNDLVLQVQHFVRDSLKAYTSHDVTQYHGLLDPPCPCPFEPHTHSLSKRLSVKDSQAQAETPG